MNEPNTPSDPEQVPPSFGAPPPPPPSNVTPPPPPSGYTPSPPPSGFPPPPPPLGYPTPAPMGMANALTPGSFNGQTLVAWPQRVLATLVDAAFYIVLYIVVIIVAATLGRIPVLGILIDLVLYVAILGAGIWNFGYRQGKTGQSIGKAIIGIRVVGTQNGGQAIGFGLSFVRQIAHFLDGLPCYIGYLWPLWDPMKQTFADKVMSTVVIPGPKSAPSVDLFKV